MTSYVYGLFIDKECYYIGSTGNVDKRFTEHKKALYKDSHKNKQLQQTFDELAGIGEIECKVLYEVDDDIINRYVAEYLFTSFYQPTCNKFFNMSNGKFNWRMKLMNQYIADKMLKCIIHV